MQRGVLVEQLNVMLRLIIVLSILAVFVACGKRVEDPTKQVVNSHEPFIIDLAGNTLYIIPIRVKNGQCYIVGPNTDTPGFQCDFIRGK